MKLHRVGCISEIPKRGLDGGMNGISSCLMYFFIGVIRGFVSRNWDSEGGRRCGQKSKDEKRRRGVALIPPCEIHRAEGEWVFILPFFVFFFYPKNNSWDTYSNNSAKSRVSSKDRDYE